MIINQEKAPMIENNKSETVSDHITSHLVRIWCIILSEYDVQKHKHPVVVQAQTPAAQNEPETTVFNYIASEMTEHRVPFCNGTHVLS